MFDTSQPTVRFPTKFTASDDTTSLALNVHIAKDPTDHDPYADSIISIPEGGDIVCLPTIESGEASGKIFCMFWIPINRVL